MAKIGRTTYKYFQKVFMKFFSKIKLVNIWEFNIYMLAMFPILPKAAESILMILFFIASIACFSKKENKRISRKQIHSIVAVSALFIIYLLGFFYTNNLSKNLEFVIRVAPLFMFALSFGYLCYQQKFNIKLLKCIYITTLIISILYVHFFLMKTLDAGVSNWEYRKAFEAFTQVHGTYFSLWIGFALILLVDKLFNYSFSLDKKKIVLMLFAIIYLFFWQFKIGARLPLATTIFLCLVLLILKASPTIKKILVFGIPTTLFLVLFFNYKIILDKTKFSLPKGKYELKHKVMTSEEIRAGIYYCSINLIKGSPFLGYSVGDVNKRLNACYLKEIDSDVYQTFNYNSHNQYLQSFLAGGIFCFLFFVLSILFLIKKAIYNRNKIMFFLLILLTTCFLTENILSRHDGVIFYGFFINIFAFQKNKK